MSLGRSDRLIKMLLDSGKLRVKGGWKVYLRHERDGSYRPVRVWHDKDGYPKTTIKVKGRAKHLRLHRIVWVAHFKPTSLEIDHCDGDRENYRPENLHAVSHQENEHRKRWRQECAPPARLASADVPF